MPGDSQLPSYDSGKVSEHLLASESLRRHTENLHLSVYSVLRVHVTGPRCQNIISGSLLLDGSNI